MDNIKITLFGVLGAKEKRHWVRIGEIYKKFDNFFIKIIFGSLISLLIIIAHYGFVFMSTISNTLTWVLGFFSIKQRMKYISNLNIMYNSTK